MNMKSRPMPFLLYLLISINGFFSIPQTVSGNPSNVMRFELIHRPAPHHQLTGASGEPAKTRLEHVNQLIPNDNVRQQMISHKLGFTSIDDAQGSIGMPIRSGAATGTGQYFVSFRVGTPSQKFLLVADTGSDLTWMNCNHRCHHCPQRVRHRRIFRAAHSSSFKSIPCLSRMCKIELVNLFSLAWCPNPMTPCGYDYRYSDGSAAKGVFANETVTVGLQNGRKTRIHGVLIGCSESSAGRSFLASDGVMGLGYSKYSFAVKAAEKFGGKFSYCLVDHLSPANISSYLTFGGHRDSNQTNTQYTELVTDAIPPFYAVNIAGISVGDMMLRVPPIVWDPSGGGGVILDSGSSLTSLTKPAYDPVMTALKDSLKKFNKLAMGITPLEFCFNSTGFDESLVPRLVFHFADGAKLEPPVKSYVIDAASGVKCLGFVSTSFPGTSVIGNIMQQNHLWEFDLKRNKLGFAPSTCSHS